MAQQEMETLRRMIQRATARKVISTLAEALRQESFASDDELDTRYLAHLAKEVDAVAEQALVRAVKP